MLSCCIFKYFNIRPNLPLEQLSKLRFKYFTLKNVFLLVQIHDFYLKLKYFKRAKLNASLIPRTYFSFKLQCIQNVDIFFKRPAQQFFKSNVKIIIEEKLSEFYI